MTVKTADNMGKFLKSYYSLMNKYMAKHKKDWRQQLKQLKKQHEKYTRSYKNKKLEDKGFFADDNLNGEKGWVKPADDGESVYVVTESDGMFGVYQYGVTADGNPDFENLVAMTIEPYADVDKLSMALARPKNMPFASPAQIALNMKEMQRDGIEGAPSDEDIIGFCKQYKVSDSELEELGLGTEEKTEQDAPDEEEKADEAPVEEPAEQQEELKAPEDDDLPEMDESGAQRCKGKVDGGEGRRCKNYTHNENGYCEDHQSQAGGKQSMYDEMMQMVAECMPKQRCAYVKDNRRCTRAAKVNGYCTQHAKILGKVASTDEGDMFSLYDNEVYTVEEVDDGVAWVRGDQGDYTNWSLSDIDEWLEKGTLEKVSGFNWEYGVGGTYHGSCGDARATIICINDGGGMNYTDYVWRLYENKDDEWSGNEAMAGGAASVEEAMEMVEESAVACGFCDGEKGARRADNFATAPRIPDSVDIDSNNAEACPLCGDPNFDGSFCNVCGYEEPPKGFDDIDLETPESYDEYAEKLLEDEADDGKPKFDPDSVKLDKELEDKANELAEGVSDYEEPNDDELAFA